MVMVQVMGNGKKYRYPGTPGIDAPGYGIGIGKFYLNLMMKMKDESTNESTTYMYESER